MIPSQSAHQRELFTYLICILSIYTRRSLVEIKMVMIQTDTCRNAIMLIQISLEHQRSVAIALVCVVQFVTIYSILMMQ